MSKKYTFQYAQKNSEGEVVQLIHCLAEGDTIKEAKQNAVERIRTVEGGEDATEKSVKRPPQKKTK